MHISYDRLSLNTVKLYPSKLTTFVEHNFSSVLPDKFAVVFDRQTTPKVHYVVVFATLRKECELGYISACLVHSSLENEKLQDADEQIFFLEFALDVFEKSQSNVVAIIGDNCKKQIDEY